MSVKVDIFTIYKATNTITNDCYIGFTSKWPKRKLAHAQNAMNKDGGQKYWNKFYMAIRRYGWDNFKWEILYQSTDYEHCLKEMEPYFIAIWQPKYNMSKGGEGPWNMYRPNNGRRTKK